MLKNSVFYSMFVKRRRIIRGTIYMCVCMYVYIYIYVPMYVCSHTVTPPLELPLHIAHLLPPPFEIE